ncbi:bactofilin family protein [Alteriqipengyuania lutimaris]|uniref:bactofilin family protein n=1 Tax=Alteriqipengyuania lutimaris TaxID=1538146 RepID=UPI00185D0776|nr:polymer-forming cytoskeletal protein [Alteriqipengyuania lutimaris]MBB3034398.1 cytoskeletal protein CcmA (bactofilin family) [Alteriqipengyuania lutimaris]
MSKGSSSSGSFSVLGSDVTIAGNITASTELHIDGNVEGDIDCSSLVQGEGSQITGEVTAESARLAGRVEGSIHARELVILRSANINGDVHYEALTVEQGASVQGRFAPRDAAPAPSREAPGASETSSSNGAASHAPASSTTADLGISPFSSDNDTDGETETSSNYY